MSTVSFVTGWPALMVNSSLVISDIHLGLEYDYRKGGIKLPSQTVKLTKMAQELIDIAKPERLIITGDLKHKVPGISFQETKEVPEFLSALLDKVPVELVPGNHDAGIKSMIPSGIKVHRSVGFRMDDVYFGHGHTWPEKKAFECSHMIIGHRHPLVEFRDRLGYSFRERVWVKGKLDPVMLKRRYTEIPEKLPDVIVVPAFNPFLGGASYNRKISGTVKEQIGPLLNSMDERKSLFFMLDGTMLGTLREIHGDKLN
ncbi:MAG: metallophosphoesterase [Candidatus Aenigmarchaeota archaeon]|nr:metallophosphoesterase [Candidatus Aenigmarchaeota archaeon]